MARGEHQIKIRFPDEMVEAIRASAKANGRSMNSEVVALIRGADAYTLRDKFAGQALSGLLAADTNTEWPAKGVALTAYEIADAMIAARRAGA